MNFAEDCEDVLIPDALEYYLGINEDLFDPEMMGLYGDEDDEDDDDEDDGAEGKPK